MSTDGQRIKWRGNIAENFNRLSRVHERYIRQRDDRRTGDSIANVNVNFTFAKKQLILEPSSRTAVTFPPGADQFRARLSLLPNFSGGGRIQRQLVKRERRSTRKASE